MSSPIRYNQGMLRRALPLLFAACATAPVDSAPPLEDGVGADSDCARVPWYADADADGFGDGSRTVEACTPPFGMIADGLDCDDGNAAISPAAAESCNELDDDCDGDVDEDVADAPVWFLDADEDGYGDLENVVYTCEVPFGFVADATDCDDLDPRVHPDADESDCADPTDYNCDGSVAFEDRDGDGWSACEECDDGDSSRNPAEAEVCSGHDEDCDGLIDDEDPDLKDVPGWYRDADGDGFGNDALIREACVQPPGFAPDGGDCDDSDSWRSPGKPEVCDDEDLDEDCSGLADDDDVGTDPATFSTFGRDSDGDGYGNASRTVFQCDPPAFYVDDLTDCDDSDAAANPGEAEVCDAVDNDCDTLVDDDDSPVSGAPTWYADRDGDGLGDPTVVSDACAAPSGYVANADDCDDADATVGATPGGCATLPSPSSAPVRFIAVGDTGDGGPGQYAVAAGMEAVCAASGCDFVLLLGDNFYPGGVTSTSDSLWTDAFEAPYAGLDLQFWAVMGNHDWNGGTDTRYLNAQVDYTAISPKWYMPADYYARTEGDVTFYGIDTQVIDTGGGAAQEAWLPAERAASTSTWNILFGHHPYVSNGPHGNAAGAVETFFDDHVCGEFDVYFAGHDHNLQWLQDPCGIEPIVSGGGHSSYALMGTNATWFEAASTGFVWVEIDGRDLTGVFYDKDGVELFRRTITK